MIYEGPKKLKVVEIDDLPIKPDEVRINTLYSGISHGTEMNIYRGYAPFFRRKSDWDIRLFMPANQDETWNYPIHSWDDGVWYMGYSNVGKVVEIGNEVSNIKVGDIVHTDAAHQSQVIRKVDQIIKLPDGIKPEYGVFYTNLCTAFNGILDSQIKLGDKVALSGLEVIGQLLVQVGQALGCNTGVWYR